MSDENVRQAYENARWLCGKSEKCSYDVLLYLKKYELTHTQRNEIVAQLTDEKFIDNARYALAFTMDKFRFNRWGRIKIRYELNMKKIPAAAIEDALAQIDETEYAKTIKMLILQRKMEAPSPFEYSQKILRYMFGKGFEPELVEGVLQTLDYK